MDGYSELQNHGGDESHNDSDRNQENFTMYDPGTLETTEENWESWHTDEVSFSGRTIRRRSSGHEICCGVCTCCSGIAPKSRRRLYLVFLCFAVLVCILIAVVIAVIFGMMSLHSSPKYITRWYDTAVGYQIFPRSYQDSDGDGFGDLKGIISRLDYLQDLGVDVIWLCSISPSPYTHIGLDITNFTGVDPLLGDLEDFRNLIQTAHDKGMKLVLEYVPNHSSEEHDWFRQSRQSRNSPYSDFYIWADGISEGEPPNDWKDPSGNSNWKYEPSRKQWYHHSFLDTEPSLNYDNSNIQLVMTDALRFWFQQGIDGVYIRHVNHLLGTSEIQADQNGFTEPQNEYTTSHYNKTRSRRASISSSLGSPERTKSLIKKWRDVLEEFETSEIHQKLLVVDSYGSPMTITTSLYGTNEEILADYPFNYALFEVNNHRITGHTIRYVVEQSLVRRPKHAPTNWAFGSPEISRLSTRYEPRFLGAITLLTLTLPGSALLYYGEEIGMIDGADPVDGTAIPYSPMQWDSSAYGGFTEGNSTWTGVPNNSFTNNVESQKSNGSSILNLVRSMIELRRQEPALGDPSEDVHLYSLQSMKELVIFVRHPKDPGNVAGLLFVANVANYEVTENYQLIVKSTDLPDRGDVVIATNNTFVGQEVNLTQLKLYSGDAIIVKFQINL